MQDETKTPLDDFRQTSNRALRSTLAHPYYEFASYEFDGLKQVRLSSEVRSPVAEVNGGLTVDHPISVLEIIPCSLAMRFDADLRTDAP